MTKIGQEISDSNFFWELIFLNFAMFSTRTTLNTAVDQAECILYHKDIVSNTYTGRQGL